MQTRRLGRTALQVSIVGFGGTWISELNTDSAVNVVKRAFDLGINYFDTAKLDGDSEEKIGLALQNVRDKCIIATKTGSRTKKESLDDVQSSLKRLRTNKIDIMQLHGIDDEKTLKKAISNEGSLETCKKARSKGLVDFIGISGHKPRLLTKAIKTGEFDTVLVPLNMVTRQALEELLPAAKEEDVGVVAMKPLSAKTSSLITCLYKPSLSLVSDEPDLRGWLGQDNVSMVSAALRYVLSQDIAVTIPGLRSVEEVDIAAKIGKEFTRLSNQEKAQFEIQFGDFYCRDCGLCMPCPQNVDVAAILRFQTLSNAYGLRSWAAKLYGGLKVKAGKCNECKLCQERCPYKLPIISLLKKAREDFPAKN
jgi:predicted aldo/keto reductase-like oxidoreductase